MICLDTNAVIAVLNSRTSPVRSRMVAALNQRLAISISSIVLFELRYGAAKSAHLERNVQRIADFLAGDIAVLPFEPADAEEAGDIRAALERAGAPIGPMTFSLLRKRAACSPARHRERARVHAHFGTVDGGLDSAEVTKRATSPEAHAGSRQSHGSSDQ